MSTGGVQVQFLPSSFKKIYYIIFLENDKRGKLIKKRMYKDKIIEFLSIYSKIIEILEIIIIVLIGVAYITLAERKV